MTDDIGRIARSPRIRDIGMVNSVFCALAARRQGVPRAHLFTTLGQHRRLLWSWLPFGGMLLRGGKLPKRDTELVILRVGHLRGSHYELQHHTRMARSVGLDDATQRAIFAGPQAPGLTDRQRLLVTAVDELVDTRTLSAATRDGLAGELGRARLIEFVMLTTQYDALAATLSALEVPLDYPQ